MGILISVPKEDKTKLQTLGITLVSEIGRGCNGVIYRAAVVPRTGSKIPATESRVAVKCINLKERMGDNIDPIQAKEKFDLVQQEKMVCMRLKHRNVVCSYVFLNCGDGVIEDNPFEENVSAVMALHRVYIAMEYADRGTLHNFIRGSITEQTGRSLVRDIVNGLHYIHTESIAHGDIHAGNVLIFIDRTDTKKVVAKWADFGMTAIDITDRYRFLKDICKLAKVTRDIINAIKYPDSNRDDFNLAFDMMMNMERVANMDISQILSHQWFHKQ